jgi:hypothetical protein
MYAETGDNSSPVQSGLAIANNSAAPVTVTLQLLSLAGTPTGFAGQIVVPPQGHVATFLSQINGFQTLTGNLRGLLEISAYAGIYTMGLRGRYNERGDFLMTSTLPVDENAPASTSPLYFPQVAAGGGFTTQLILFNTSGGQLASGSLQMLDNNGSPLNLTLSK